MAGFFQGIKDKVTNVLLTPGSEINDNPPDDKEYYEEDDYDEREYEDDYEEDEDYDSPRDRRSYGRSRNRDYDRGRSSDRGYRSSSSRTRRPWQDHARDAINRSSQQNDYDESANNDTKSNSIVIRHPRNVSECPHIVRSLLENKVCVVSVVDVPPAEARRIVDYLCGSAQTLVGAKIRKISETLNVYVIAPPGVDIDLQDLKRDLEREETYRSTYPKGRRD